MVNVEQFKEAARVLDKHALTLDEINELMLKRLGVIAVDARKVTAYQNAKVGAVVEGRPIVIERSEE